MADEVSVKQAALGDLGEELETTRRLLAAIPTAHLAWKPHDRSWPLGALAAHTVNLLHWQLLILEQDEFDLASAPPPRSTGPESTDELLRQFDERAAALHAAVAALDDEVLSRPWILRHGPRTILANSKALVFRRMGTSHLIHHRAQLGLYLRLLDVPVPASYGPTGDESGN
ncbi:MAG: DinB family protein [Gemmatimonadales bacterium]|jgi:uncharacterized damage-inducible protein DinB